MTTIVYNDVVLRNCELKSFDQSVEYDSSNTDVMFSRFRISVESTVVAVRNQSAPTNSFGVDTPVGHTSVQKAHDVHARLSEARKDFWFLVDNCVDNEKDGLGFSANILDQPLLIAAGEAYSYKKEQYTAGAGEVRERIVKTPLFMLKHPFSLNSFTNQYGPGDALLDKSTVSDCANGPKPIDVRVDKIIGGRSLRVQFVIEVCRNVCKIDFEDGEPVVSGVIEGSGNAVLSNRWYLDESKDDNWITTRSMQGTLRVANKEIWPHAMRYLCVPSLLRGYQRVQQSYVDDPTGLVLKYRIDDKQAHAAPPWPAIKWSGHHTEAATGSNGTIKTSEFQIRLTGAPGVDKQQLIGAAGKIAVNRIRGLVPTFNAAGERIQNAILKNASVVDVIDQPVIEMRVQTQYVKDEFTQLALNLRRMGEPIGTIAGPSAENPFLIDGYDPQVWPVPLTYDSASPAGVFACYLQHPCSVWHDMPNDFPVPADGSNSQNIGRPSYDESRDGSSYNTTDQPANVFRIDQRLPNDLDSIRKPYMNPDIYQFPYSYVELQNSYKFSGGWVQLPFAEAEPVPTASGYNPTAALVKMHAKTARRILTMVATREGKPPIIPSLREEGKDHNGIREVLNDVEITAKAPELLSSGQGRRYAVQIRYEYLLDRAPTPAEKLRTGSMPWDIFTPAQNWMDLSAYVDATGRLQTEIAP